MSRSKLLIFGFQNEESVEMTAASQLKDAPSMFHRYSGKCVNLISKFSIVFVTLLAYLYLCSRHLSYKNEKQFCV